MNDLLDEDNNTNTRSHVETIESGDPTPTEDALVVDGISVEELQLLDDFELEL